MTQIWPGFGVAPVPTVESIICKPEAVVMVFPAVWAAAMVGAHANGTAMIVIAIAETIEILASWRRRIFGHFPVTNGTCLAQRDPRCHPITSYRYPAGSIWGRHSGAMRSIEPGIARFRVWC